MDALNRNQVGPGCKTQAMVKVSGVKAKGQAGLLERVGLAPPPTCGPSPGMRAASSSSQPFPQPQAY